MADELDADAAFFAPASAYEGDPDVVPRGRVVPFGRGGDGAAGRARQAAEVRDMTDAERAAIPAFPFKPWGHRDLAAIPVPEFVYGHFYARGYTSVTVAPPKVGKSMLGLGEALDMATGRGFLTGHRREPLRVVYYNAEDDEPAISARTAALLTLYGIPQEEIAETFYPHSGVGEPDFYLVSGQDPVINERLFVSIEKFCEAARADVLIFDPLQDLTRSPETNDVFRILGQRLRRLASTCRVALGLVHHTRKLAAGTSSSIDDMRGGSALRGTARFNRLLAPMTDEEGVRAGVANHRYFFRIGDVESNLAPPSAEVNRWFEKVSVHTPNGAHFGAVRPWAWPDTFAGVTAEDAGRVRQLVAEREGDPPAENPRNKAWVGQIVAQVLGLDLEDKAQKARVIAMVKTWVTTGVLLVETTRSARDGRDVKVVLAGPNDPLREERA